jgi:hypothetical protein
MSNPKPPVDLGLVMAIHAFAQQGMIGDNQPQTAALRVQLETLGGKSYFLSLTVETARSLILGISNWPPVQDYLFELAQPGPTHTAIDLDIRGAAGAG